MISSKNITICDVCRLHDFDVSTKWCSYCGMCDANICDADLSRWDRRLRAWAKKKLEPGFKDNLEYEKIIKDNVNAGI
jgi:hypothetical protein